MQLDAPLPDERGTERSANQSGSLAGTKWLALGVVAVVLGLVLRDAWVAEDAYITLRTVDNWVHGLGLRWNADERVQGYTHPLWMLILSAGYFVTREAYGTTIILGMATTLASLLLLVRCARTAGHAIAALSLLMLSRAFVDFSTSGLENPLTHLLLALFTYQYAVRRDAGLTLLSCTAALLALTRVDAALAVLPALLHVIGGSLQQSGLKRTLRALLLGFSPLLAWELFSVFYYGFPVPNTAYAKLNTGLPRNEVLRQGATYLLNAVAWDPAILVGTVLGVASVFAQRRTRPRLLALGAALYVVYVVWIGGDFMQGRFLTLPLFLSACLLAVSELPLAEPARTALVVFPFAFFFWHPAAKEKYPSMTDFDYAGIADERSVFPGTHLMRFKRIAKLPAHDWVNDGKTARGNHATGVVHENVGMYGFYAGPSVHIIDRLALTEPLLARLPSEYKPNWRVGHYGRRIPDGYVQTVTSGRCFMTDKNLCAYYEKLHEVVAGKLWSWSRLKTVVLFNFGAYNGLVDRQAYRYPSLDHVLLGALAAPVAEGAPSNGPGTRALGDDGLSIALPRLAHKKQLRVSLDGDDVYTVELFAGTQLLHTMVAPALAKPGMRTRVLGIPSGVQKQGFDSITVRPADGETFAIGQLRLE